jgi:hypothetical protein
MIALSSQTMFILKVELLSIFLWFCVVTQIIMAKPAGGPKPPSGKKDWDDDQND